MRDKDRKLEEVEHSHTLGEDVEAWHTVGGVGEDGLGGAGQDGLYIHTYKHTRSRLTIIVLLSGKSPLTFVLTC